MPHRSLAQSPARPAGATARRAAAATWFVLALAMALGIASSPVGVAPRLQIAATTGNLGALVREVGGNAVEVSVLAPPDTELRRLTVQPAMIRALRRADLLVALGNGLEDAWLPAAIAASANPHDLSPGQPRRFDAVEVPRRTPPLAGAKARLQPLDQARLDLDPVHMAQLSHILAERLGSLDPEVARTATQRADAFTANLFVRMPQWQQQARHPASLLLYSAEPLTLLERFGVVPIAVMEPIPGVAPTGANLADIIERMQGQSGVIIVPSYADQKAPRLVAGRLDWKLIALPLDAPANAAGDGYLEHIAAWVDVATGLRTR